VAVATSPALREWRPVPGQHPSPLPSAGVAGRALFLSFSPLRACVGGWVATHDWDCAGGIAKVVVVVVVVYRGVLCERVVVKSIPP